MMSLSDSCIAETLSDLNMFYIRQIGASLKKHVGLQDQLEKEIKIRSAALRLIEACTQEMQLLEVAKSLHGSNVRSFSCMTKLQQLKKHEMVEAMLDDQEFADESRICKGRIAVSDIRVPLIWKDSHSNSKSKEHSRHAVFCLVALDSDVQETTMVYTDRSSTDISFPDNLIFESARYDFKMIIRIFAYPVSSKNVSSKNSQKLLARFNRHGMKNDGKKIREHLRENANKGFRCSPLFDEIGSLTLALGDVADAVKSHDLSLTNQHRLYLPVYESMSCRLVAQPECITDVTTTGYVSKLETSQPNPFWGRCWCELKAGYLRGWSDVTKEDLKFSIDLFSNAVKITEIETLRQLRSNSFQVTCQHGRYIFSAKDNEEMIDWIRNLRKHKSDIEAWGEACMADCTLRTPLFIRPLTPQRHSSEYLFENGVKNALLYHGLGTGQRQHSDEAYFLDRCSSTQTHSDIASSHSDLSVSSSSEMTDCAYLEVAGLNEKEISGFDFTQRRRSHGNKIQSSSVNDEFGGCFLNKSSREKNTKQQTPDSGGGKKKKRAPLCPQVKNPLPNEMRKQEKRPPLPPVPPPNQKLRIRKMESSSSGSSLDGILEERLGKESIKLPKPKPRFNDSLECLHYGDRRRRSHPADSFSHDSLQSHQSSQSSGYRSEVDSNHEKKLQEEVWVKLKHCYKPLSKIGDQVLLKKQQLQGFERTQSLGTDELLQSLTCSQEADSFSSLMSSSVEKMHGELSAECRPRTNTMPQASPKVSLRINHREQIQRAAMIKPIPTPRKPRNLQQLSSKSLDADEPIYDVPADYARRENGSSEKNRFQPESGQSSRNDVGQNSIYAKIRKEKLIT